MAMYNPCHPGELLLDVIEGLREETNKSFTIDEIAKGLKTSRKTLSAIINGRQSITAEMSLKISVAFGSSPDFWLRLQESYDLAQARRKFDAKGIRVFYKKKKIYLKLSEDEFEKAWDNVTNKEKKVSLLKAKKPKKAKTVRTKRRYAKAS